MENDLISRSALRTLAYHVTDNIIGVERCVVDWDDIEDAPTIDPGSLRPKGRWIMTVYTTTSKRRRVISNKKFSCSECGYGNGRKQSSFCPNCGADMLGV